MNSQQAKKINIIDYLDSNGIVPAETKENIRWYKSLLRIENTASFKVDTARNLWYDFGAGIGGNIIDLIMQLNNCTVSEALNILSNNTASPTTKSSFSFHQQNDIRIKELEHVALLEYIQYRGIEIDIAKAYCKEGHYSIQDKHYFAIAFKTDSNTYELRNKYVKINLGGKDITTIRNGYKTVNVFEGFFDFLSYIQLNNNLPGTDFLIMNSVSMLTKTIEALKQYDTINLWLDNEPSGHKTTSSITNNIPNCINHSPLYTDYKDLNDYLLVKRKI
jgi:hypothetical protein